MAGPTASNNIDLVQEPMTALAEYARIPIAFTVDRVLDVRPRTDGRGGFVVSEPSAQGRDSKPNCSGTKTFEETLAEQGQSESSS